MQQNGLREVSNPSELLLSQNHEGLSGVAIASAIEGIRPFLIDLRYAEAAIEENKEIIIQRWNEFYSK